MKKNKFVILIILIILLAAFLRLYRISDYMTFLGDEGRDVLVAKGILEGHFTLLGPRSSAGDFFMGPAYYYMITPFLWLFRYDPVGPAVMVALFGIATVFLVYYSGKKFFDQKTALFASALYAVSPLVIIYSHSSWNPNILPFFSLLIMYLLYKAISEDLSWEYYAFIGFLLGIAMQLHYLALFLAIIMFLYIFFGNWIKNKKIETAKIIKQFVQVTAGFIAGISPFLLFELRHGFPNTHTIITFIFGQTLQKGYETHSGFFSIVSDVFFRLFARFVFNYPFPDRYHNYSPLLLQIWAIVIIIAILSSIILLFFKKNKLVVLLFSLWLFFGVLLFGLYKKTIYDYLFTFIFPLPFLLTGNLLSAIYNFRYKKIKWIGIFVSMLLFLVLFVYNLSAVPFRYPPNRQKDQTKQIADFVISKTNNKPFNFALLSAGNSDHAYRYFLETAYKKPITIENPAIDPDRKTVTGQLLIVCEDIKCKPLGHPLWEIAGFGRAEIAGEWDVSVVKVYKLIHIKKPQK